MSGSHEVPSVIACDTAAVAFDREESLEDDGEDDSESRSSTSSSSSSSERPAEEDRDDPAEEEAEDAVDEDEAVCDDLFRCFFLSVPPPPTVFNATDLSQGGSSSAPPK